MNDVLRRGPGQTRRAVLGMGATTLAISSVSACDLLATDPDDNSERDNHRDGDEVPMLVSRVKDGTLPPLAERLPETPLVMEPLERTGRYGGTVRNAFVGAVTGGIYRLTYENLVRWTEEWTGAAGTDELIPHVAERYEVNGDSTEFTFWLRRGTRWSNGEPFTVDDVLFAVNDVLLNEELFPVPPSAYMSAGEPPTVEKLDDHSFTIRFGAPHGLFLQKLATSNGQYPAVLPRHYLERFHPKYNPDIDAVVAESGAADWVELFGSKCGPGGFAGQNPDLPTLGPWRLLTSFAVGDEEVVLERNPFYWATDSAGNQLPYIDELVYAQVNDLEVLLLRALNGEINMELTGNTRFTSLANKPIISRSRTDGNYRFLELVDTRMNVMTIYLNLTHSDAMKREVFRAKDFRVGLSHAIDRNELIKVTMQGQGEPCQAAPLPNSPFYDEDLATQYLDYDVDAANESLDRVLPDKGADGMRLGPDGKRFVFTIEYVADYRSEWSPMLELVQGYVRAVGVDARLRNVTRNAMLDRTTANQHDATVWQGDAGLSMLLAPADFIGTLNYFAALWAQWYNSGGAEGEEPPEETRRQMELYDRILLSTDPDEQGELLTEILRISREQFYHIGTVRETQLYTIVANQLRNVPKQILQSWEYPTPGPTRPEQYFFATDS